MIGDRGGYGVVVLAEVAGARDVRSCRFGLASGRCWIVGTAAAFSVRIG
jgi:hypothetical protein